MYAAILAYIVSDMVQNIVHNVVSIFVNIGLKLLKTLFKNWLGIAQYILDFFTLYTLHEFQFIARIVHIVPNCTKLFNICQYLSVLFNCTKLFNLCQYCFNLCQYCSEFVLSFLSEMPAAAASILDAASILAASMLPVPLTVLLLYEFAATLHLLSTTAPCEIGRASCRERV